MDAVRLLRHLQPLADVMNKTSQQLPQLFTQSSDLDHMPQKQDDTVLREWEMESDHDYENNMNLTTVRLLVSLYVKVKKRIAFIY